MGHMHLGTLSRSRKFRQIVDLLNAGAGAEQIAAATSEAAERSMIDASKDPAFIRAFWLLTQIPLVAKKEHFAAELRRLGLKVSDRPSLIEVITAFSNEVDRQVREVGGRTDLGEMTQLCAAESLSAVAGRELPRLFGPTPEDAKLAIAGLGTVKQFSVLARDFFSRLTQRHLNYYLSRELSNHVGANSRFRSVREHDAFDKALDLHCRETSRIIKEFSGEWYSKTNYQGGIDENKAGGFANIAFKKIRAELRKRRSADD